MEKRETIIDVFQNIVNKYPKNKAVVSYDWECTYEQLNNAANNLATKIENIVKDIQKPILVFCDSPKMISTSLFAIFKSRNIYVPVSNKTPINRIKKIIEDCNIKYYIAEEEHKELNLSFINSYIENENNSNFIYNGSKDDIAYIIYTSGTTGNSKGVVSQHKGLINTILERNRILNLKQYNNSIILMGLTFDGFFTSFLCPLVLGAIIYFPNDILDISSLDYFFNSFNIDNILCTPTMLRTLLDIKNGFYLSKLNLVSLAGEPVSKDLISKSVEKFPTLQISNEYGPSENSICTSINKDIRNQKIITTGKTIENVEAKIFNKKLKSIKNEIGELYLSGIGLSKGYINDKALTNQKFITINNKRWYKTGDLAYINNEDELVILERIDKQVKVNGYRVDLLEIQNAILEIESIKACVVDYNKKEGITAYYCAEILIDKEKIIQYLKTKLNDYMLPHNYFQIKSMPMLDSGKVDFKKLKELQELNLINEKNLKEYEKFKTKLCQIYKDILKIDNVKDDDSFFYLGGNSLSCIILIEKLKECFNIEIDYDTIRTNSSAKALAIALFSIKQKDINKINLKPFNRFWFVDCYFTSILSIFEKESLPIAPFIRQFKIIDVEFNDTYQILYENKKPLKEIFADFGMNFDAGILENDFNDKILPFVKDKKTVMLHVDCFYLPYCKEKYKKEHFEHVIALVNYDEISKSFDVIDQENLQSVSFCYHKLNLQDAINSAYAEIVNRKTFDNVDFVSIYPSNKKELNFNNLDDTQFNFVINHTITYLKNNFKDASLVLQRLINYLQVEKEVFKFQGDEKRLQDFNKKEAKLKRLLMNFIIDGLNEFNKNTLLDLLNEWLIGEKDEN